MEITSTEQSAANMEYVRRLLRQKERGFSVALELAVLAVERELTAAAMRPGAFARDRYAKSAGPSRSAWPLAASQASASRMAPSELYRGE